MSRYRPSNPRFDSRYIDLANKALDDLQDRYTMRSTSAIVKACGLTTADQKDMRTVLDMLFVAGVVEKDIVGRHTWKMKDPWRSWDRADPFAAVAPVKEKPVEPPPPVPSDVETDGADETPAADENVRLEGLENTLASLTHKVNGLDALTCLQQEKIDRLETQLKEKAATAPRVITVQRFDKTETKLKDVQLPAFFPTMQELAECRRNVLLVGPAGCGKTTAAKLLAKVLGLDFYKVGGSAGLQEHHLLGKARPNVTTGKDRFQTTPFLKAFEHGGVCLIDEIDAADPNAMLVLNAALDDSAHLPVPNREDGDALKHPDFVCVSTANTFGRGANRVYAGRNQLDEATLDRFRIGTLECEYDRGVETAVCPTQDIREWCWRVRARIEEAGLRRVMSTRFLADAHLMHENRGWDLTKVKECYFSGWSRDERAKVEY